MSIFHLKPIAAALENEAWSTSTFRGECWVNATSEEEARGIASGRFQEGGASLSHAPSPWRDGNLVQAQILLAAPNNMTIPPNTVVAGTTGL